MLALATAALSLLPAPYSGLRIEFACWCFLTTYLTISNKYSVLRTKYVLNTLHSHHGNMSNLPRYSLLVDSRAVQSGSPYFAHGCLSKVGQV